MNKTTLISLAFMAVLSVVAGPAVASEGAAPRSAQDGPRDPGARVVQIAVTTDGFVPDHVTVKAGQNVKLVVTRKTDQTCATEIVMKDFGVKEALPLGKPVTVSIIPKKPGDYRYACGMDMVAGVLEAR